MQKLNRIRRVLASLVRLSPEYLPTLNALHRVAFIRSVRLAEPTSVPTEPGVARQYNDGLLFATSKVDGHITLTLKKGKEGSPLLVVHLRDGSLEVSRVELTVRGSAKYIPYLKDLIDSESAIASEATDPYLNPKALVTKLTGVEDPENRYSRDEVINIMETTPLLGAIKKVMSLGGITPVAALHVLKNPKADSSITREVVKYVANYLRDAGRHPRTGITVLKAAKNLQVLDQVLTETEESTLRYLATALKKSGKNDDLLAIVNKKAEDKKPYDINEGFDRGRREKEEEEARYQEAVKKRRMHIEESFRKDRERYEQEKEREGTLGEGKRRKIG